jgi:hypothetical protein
MTQPVNLNKARKARDKAQAKLDAANNRARFGRTKTAKDAERIEAERRERTLDLTKRDPKP